MRRVLLPLAVIVCLLPLLGLAAGAARVDSDTQTGGAESLAPSGAESLPVESGYDGSAAEVESAVSAESDGESDASEPEAAPSAPAESGDYAALTRVIRRDRIEANVRTLSSVGSRLAGTPGCDIAGAWLVSEFRKIGLEDVRIEEFEVTVPVNHGSDLAVGGTAYDIHPLWPNLVRTCKVDADGLEARVVDCGSATLDEFGGKEILDSIVLMDWTPDVSWFNAPLLGASAVVFIEPELISRGSAESKFLSVPADVPRFWISREEGLALRERLASQPTGIDGALRCDVRWEKRKTFNVLGEITGTETGNLPESGSMVGNEQRIVLTAYYDAMSVVPDLAPGAENAASVVALLEVARALKASPPKRSVLFLATSGHFQFLSGIRNFFERRIAAMKRDAGAVATIKESAEGALPDTIGPLDVAAVFGLDLSSRNDLVCAFYKGYFHDYREDIQWKYADYGKFANERGQAIHEALGLPGEASFADAINSITGKNWRSYLPARIGMDFEEAALASRPGIGLCTGNDSRALTDTPHDTPDRMDFDNLDRQARFIACLLKDSLDDPKLGGIVDKNDKYQEFDKDLFCTAQGRVVEFQPKNGEYMPNTPVPGAVVVTRGYPKTTTGIRGDCVQLVDREARFAYKGMMNVKYGRGGGGFEAYFLDPKDGRIIMAPDRGAYGDKLRKLLQNIDAETKDWKITLFDCATTNLFDIIDQRQFALCGALNVLETQSDAEPFEYGYSLPIPPQQWDSYYEPVATVFSARQPMTAQEGGAKSGDEERLKLLMGAGSLGMRFILLNSSPEKPNGTGFDFTENPKITPTPYYVARDLWTIDDDRIRTLAKYGIENKRSSDMHLEAKEYLDDAEAARAELDYKRFLSSVRSALAYEMRVYPDVMKTTTDVVKAVIFYLALLIPFAYFIERLFIASPHIARQVAGAAGCFLVIFLVLWVVHPAFEITRAPVIVLLAFVMLSLSIMVASLLVSRFDHRMRLVRQQVTGVRETDVGRLGASGMAFALGVANMRRRKTRTALTCITLILLTFTVMSFTSVVEQLVVNKRATEPGGNYQGVLIRDLKWEPIGMPARRIIENEYEGREGVAVAPRAWYMAVQVGTISYVTLEYDNNTADARALVGFSAAEDRVTGVASRANVLTAGRWFADDDRGPKCILPSGLCEQLGLTADDVAAPGREGAQVIVLGRHCELIGIFDPESVRGLTDVDSEILTPVDYDKMQDQRRQGGGSQGGGGEDVVERYIHLSPDQVGFVNLDFALDEGASLRSIAISFGDQETLEREMEPLLRRVELHVYSRQGDGNYLMSTRTKTDFTKGAGSVLVPILIAAMIVLNTMLGSVYERTKEIGIFSSLGLAPIHVASLFVAEALVYAVLGAVVGYLVGQTTSKVIVMTDWLDALSLNYSSLSAVATVIVVMLTVLGSTIYPARMASRLATPGIDRRWKMVDPRGGILAVELPFSSTSGDVRGLNMFLMDYFGAHVEYSTGRFSADNVGLALCPGAAESNGRPMDVFQLGTTLWLAPYDLGVRERFTLISLPTPEMGEESYGFWALIQREDGDEASWMRLTRNLLTILRQQFLLWRTFDLETRTPYIERPLDLPEGDLALLRMLERARDGLEVESPEETPKSA